MMFRALKGNSHDGRISRDGGVGGRSQFSVWCMRNGLLSRKLVRESSHGPGVGMKGGGREMSDEVVVELSTLINISQARSCLWACLPDESR